MKLYPCGLAAVCSLLQRPFMSRGEIFWMEPTTARTGGPEPEKRAGPPCPVSRKLREYRHDHPETGGQTGWQGPQGGQQIKGTQNQEEGPHRAGTDAQEAGMQNQDAQRTAPQGPGHCQLEGPREPCAGRQPPPSTDDTQESSRQLSTLRRCWRPSEPR